MIFASTTFSREGESSPKGSQPQGQVAMSPFPSAPRRAAT